MTDKAKPPSLRDYAKRATDDLTPLELKVLRKLLDKSASHAKKKDRY